MAHVKCLSQLLIYNKFQIDVNLYVVLGLALRSVGKSFFMFNYTLFSGVQRGNPMVKKVIGSKERVPIRGYQECFSGYLKKLDPGPTSVPALSRLEPQYCTPVSAGARTPFQPFWMWTCGSFLLGCFSNPNPFLLLYLPFCSFLVLFLLMYLVERKGIPSLLRGVGLTHPAQA